ncbi:type IV pili methyl-accepting chemotaxis transducer N-terminal domain-containing protein [Oceanicella actignis]|uniref:type IV pili methyl-accepting chemotaxis transducer N-terminal domain-containing protein n=1 Tax=Oceanicella actignis TaxID=1189325 RepID=UPI0011E7F714|nr:type IV pili methyl-accepting chemotaxis transducer N-terminal domain-containing protein [Oceanicella actignis]TYO91653.1 PilJ/NarX-like methyl-accepting chemotaxis transducer [Oceanicella actignis]
MNQLSRPRTIIRGAIPAEAPAALSRRALLTLAGAALLAPARGGAAAADPALARIRLAGKLRALAPRLPAAACMARLSGADAPALAHMRDCWAAFLGAARRLRDGDESLGFAAEKDFRARQALATAEAVGRVGGEAAELAAETGALTGEAFDAVLRNAESFEAHAAAAFAAIRDAHGAAARSVGAAVRMDVVTRQSLLVERIAREAALAALELRQAQEAARGIDQDAQLFAASHAALREGAPMLGIAPPPEGARAALARAEELWPDFEAAARALAASGAGADGLSAARDALAAALDAAADRYAGLPQGAI